jgi:hypothetical protein
MLSATPAGLHVLRVSAKVTTQEESLPLERVGWRNRSRLPHVPRPFVGGLVAHCRALARMAAALACQITLGNFDDFNGILLQVLFFGLIVKLRPWGVAVGEASAKVTRQASLEGSS